MCYSYFRTGHLLNAYTLDQRILLASLLLSEVCSIEEEWNSLAKNLQLNVQLTDYTIEGVPVEAWFKKQGSKVFYEVADLSSGFQRMKQRELINFRPANWIKNHKVNTIGSLDLMGCRELLPGQEASGFEQVQDLSSQYVCQKVELKDHYQVWDVCSGAGGKSLNLLSRSKSRFLLTDVRETILKNAKKRLVHFGYKAETKVLDVAQGADVVKSELPNRLFDVILADVPCSGSGTWFSEPEYFQSSPDVKKYQQLQQAIVSNALTQLKEGGWFYYMTCSVFRAENEQNTQFILQTNGIELVEEIFFNGTEHRANSMYLAVFKKV